MRVLLTVLPGTGSLRPLLPLAHALRTQAHEVAFCSAPALRPAVERERLPFFAAGLDWDTSDPRYIEVLCEAAGGLTFPPLTGMPRLAWVTNELFRCAALGVGVALEPDRRSPSDIRRAARAVLAGRAYTRRARKMQGEMAALPGPQHAVALLEALHRDPVPNQPTAAGRTP